MNRQELEAFVAQPANYEKASLPDLETLELTGRSLAVVGSILESLSVNKSKPVVLVLRLGVLIATVARILTPGSMQGLLYRQWLALLAIADGILLFAGLLETSIMAPAIKLTVITALIFAAIELCRAVVAEKGFGKRIGLGLLALATMVGLAVYAVFKGYYIYEWLTVGPDLGKHRLLFGCGLAAGVFLLFAGLLNASRKLTADS